MLVDCRCTDSERLSSLSISHGLIIVKSEHTPVLLCEVVVYHPLQLCHQFLVLAQVLS